jgi:2,5-diketo-D-gluconate reductase A
MPQLGFGVWQVPDDNTANVVGQALAAGYRLIDTAAIYGNEEGVGQAIAGSGLPRADIFVTTKLANPDHGFDSALRAIDASLKKLGTDYVDLYLIHWPRPKVDLYLDCWKALVRIREEGRARSIGVSNFHPWHTDRLLAETGVAPVLNQVELHPQFQQKALRDYHAGHGIVTQSWSPLGRGTVADNATIDGIAAAHGKTWAQVVIRWHLQSGLSVIPRSETPARIVSNFDVFDFTLSEAEMTRLAGLDARDGRIAIDPDDLNR